MVDLQKLSEYLEKSDTEMVVLSFSEIESILGSELPVEAKKTGKWWWNIKGSAKAKAWLDHGYYTDSQRSIPTRGNVCFRRTEKEPKYRKGFRRMWYFLTDKDATLHQRVMAVIQIFVMPTLAILALVVGIATLHATKFPAQSQEQIKMEFATLASEGEYMLSNRECLEAASYFRRAYIKSYDTYSKAYSEQREGICYMLYGLLQSNNDYLGRAFKIYVSIVDTPEYKDTLGYQEALIDLCYLYGAMGYNWEDPEWRSVVEQVEAMFDFDNLASISADDIPTAINAAENIGVYYETILLSDMYTFLFGEEYQEKAIYYLNVVMQLMQLETKSDKHYVGESYNKLIYLSSVKELSDRLIENAYFNAKDNLIETLEEVRTLCQNAILTIDVETGNMDQLSLYIALKRNIGKTYIFTAHESKSPDRENYMAKAYQELIPLFYWEGDKVSEDIMQVSKYILLTDLCTEDDIQLILDRFLSYLQTTQESKGIERVHEQIHIELEGLFICETILHRYDYETSRTNAQTLGQQLWAELNTVLFDFLDSSQKEELISFSDVFGT